MVVLSYDNREIDFDMSCFHSVFFFFCVKKKNNSCLIVLICFYSDFFWINLSKDRWRKGKSSSKYENNGLFSFLHEFSPLCVSILIWICHVLIIFFILSKRAKRVIFK